MNPRKEYMGLNIYHMTPRETYMWLNVHVMGKCICNSGCPNNKGATCAMCE
jgi:hypothetical protein